MMSFLNRSFLMKWLGFAQKNHSLAEKDIWEAEDFIDETWVTYPVPDDMLDLWRKVLKSKGINPTRRTTELTIAMIQLVASKRGIATVPYWAALPYLEKKVMLWQEKSQKVAYTATYMPRFAKKMNPFLFRRFLSNSQISKFLNFTWTFCFKFIDIINEFISTKSTA